ncbi:glycosyltransferase [Kitasatospora sp. NPDC056138]|uniref:glycosyltransferase n=1 Tax=Kitasatospora sp. NPDC056138 TaxID=3345724 RepID=UPI0035DC3C8A
MRVALLTEGATGSAGPATRRSGGGWCDRLMDGLAEHEFRLHLLAPPGCAVETRPGRPAAVHEFPTGGRRPPGRGPAPHRRRRYVRAYRDLVRALVLPAERGSFGAGLYRLAELAREDGALPGFLVSGPAQRTLEAIWRSPGADTEAGRPQVGDLLVAGDLLEQCLRPLSAPWYGTGAGGLGGADLCHVVGGGPAALPALVARALHGVPFVLTEHDPQLREQYRSDRYAQYRWPVRALLLGFSRLLAEETYRQAAVLTTGSEYGRQWQQRCGAAPDRIRVVYEGAAAVDRAPAGPEPELPTLLWAGALEPGHDPELVLHAFARVRADLPTARLRMYGEEGAPGPAAHCRAVADRLGLGDAVSFEDGRGGPAWETGGVLVLCARTQSSPRLLVDAMLSGRAVVTTEAGVAREVVGPAGLLVPPRSPQALAGACLALLGDGERRVRLGRAGRQRARERFAVEPVTTAFREIYLELVSSRPAFPAAASGTRGRPHRAQPFARPAEYWVAGGAESVGGGPPEPGEGDGGRAGGGRVPTGPAEPGALAEAV